MYILERKIVTTNCMMSRYCFASIVELNHFSVTMTHSWMFLLFSFTAR